MARQQVQRVAMALFVTLAIVSSMLTVTSQSASAQSTEHCAASSAFVDVPAGQYYTEAVIWAACGGITSGTSATTFSPDAPVNRAQMATFLWRFAGRPTGSPHSFVDVPAGSYYDEPVGWLLAEGITAGTSATTFSPLGNVTRGQVATFLWRHAGEPAATGSVPFTDVPAGAYYAEPVAWMYANEFTMGTSATTFSPNQTLTRAELVTFLWRISGGLYVKTGDLGFSRRI